MPRGRLPGGWTPFRLDLTGRPDRDRELTIRGDEQVGHNTQGFLPIVVPPREYLDLADEIGMLTWVEYPTWHPDFSLSRAAELEEEFREFFLDDRNAAGVLFRSLTCETGHNASAAVKSRSRSAFSIGMVREGFSGPSRCRPGRSGPGYRSRCLRRLRLGPATCPRKAPPRKTRRPDDPTP